MFVLTGGRCRAPWTSSADVRKLRFAQLASLCPSLTSVSDCRLKPSHGLRHSTHPAGPAAAQVLHPMLSGIEAPPLVVERRRPVAFGPWRPTGRTNPPTR
jgi:hypothetical protein